MLVVVVPLGGTAESVFREYVELVSQQCEYIHLSGTSIHSSLCKSRAYTH